MKLKELGTIAVGMFVILAMGMGDAPKPEAVQAFAVIEEVKEEPVKENTVKEKELTVQDQIVMACEEAGVNPEIAVAISRVETGHFASKAFTRLHNVGGLSVNEEPIAYESLEEGIAAFVDCLAWYKEDGLCTVEEIGKRWCPDNYEAWVSLVKKIMEEGYV